MEKGRRASKATGGPRAVGYSIRYAPTPAVTVTATVAVLTGSPMER